MSALSFQHALIDSFHNHSVALAYLFGSQATGQTWAKSDVDLAVLLAETVPTDQFAQLRLALTTEAIGILGRNNIDVVILNQATPLLAQQVVQFGEPIFSTDEAIRVEFEVTTLRRYVDTAILRRLQQAYLENRIREREGKPLKPLPVGLK
jgi:hypothetical protein